MHCKTCLMVILDRGNTFHASTLAYLQLLFSDTAQGRCTATRYTPVQAKTHLPVLTLFLGRYVTPHNQSHLSQYIWP